MITLFIIAYLIGSIPFGLLLTKLAGYGDIRKIGSGNIGATNVLRTGNKFLALLTLLLDGAKGGTLIFILFGFNSRWFVSSHSAENWPWQMGLPLIAGLFVVIGHCFPVWLKFKGGKGVATALGILLVTLPISGLTACLVWLATFFISRTSSLSALAAMAAAPIITLIAYDPVVSFTLNLAISAMVITRHKENIRRLLKGEELRIGTKK